MGNADLGNQTLLVLNKIDLGEHESWRGMEAVRISCLSGAGIDALAEAIFERVTGGQAAHRDWSLAINARSASLIHCRPPSRVSETRTAAPTAVSKKPSLVFSTV